MNNTMYDQTKVLLIEDDPIASSLVLIGLRQLGITNVNTVENGLMAIEYLDTNIPDLIFLDINMPEMDGFEFLNFIEQNNFIPHSSIAMLTSSILIRDKMRALRFISVIDYIEKPINIGKLEMTLHRMIENKKTAKTA